MKLEIEAVDLEPLVRTIVAETIASVESMKPSETLSWNETAAAGILGVAVHTLRDARRRGEITARQLGRAWLYERAELIRFLRESPRR